MQVTIFGQPVEVTRTEMPSGAVRYSLEYQDCTYSAMVQVGGKTAYTANNGYAVRYCDAKNDQPQIKALNKAIAAG